MKPHPFAQWFTSLVANATVALRRYHFMPTANHTGKRNEDGSWDRRADKLTPLGRYKHLRSYYARYDSPRAR